MASLKYEVNFDGYEQLDDKYRINKETGKIINRFNMFVKSKPEYKHRDYSFMKDNQKNTRKVEAKNMETNDIAIYRSLYACSKDVKVNPGMIKLCCDGKYKQAISKDNIPFVFTYSTEEPTKDVTRALTVYETKEDRRYADLERTKRNNSKRMICECGIEHAAGGKTQHMRSKRHIQFMENKENL